MKKTLQKKFYNLTLTVLIFLFLICSVAAFISINEKYTAHAYESKKILVDGYDFSDNSVLVTLDKDVGGVNKIHNKSYFDEIAVTEITDLTFRENVANVDLDRFRQILKLELQYHDKNYVLQAVEEISKLKGVEAVSPNYYGEFCATANDSYYNEQWGLKGANGINIEPTWNITTGSNAVRVGVIDSGIAQHPDLNVNLAVGKSFVDGDSSTEDIYGHGTHVAGIIGAVGDNNSGISGVCKTVELVPLKISNNGSWPWGNAIAAIVYASNSWGKDEQIDILNFSGWDFSFDALFSNVINSYNGLFVTIAGNGRVDSDGIRRGYDIDETPTYPGSFDCDNIITVGSIDSSGCRSEFSNYGINSVDIFAPGGGILSTYPEELCEAGFCEWAYDTKEGKLVPNGTKHEGNGYHTMSGTSMAAPHVTGVAALMLSYKPNLTAAELKEIILNSADDIKIKTPDGTQTVKKLNAFEAVASVVSPHSTYLRYNINTRKPFTTPINFEYIEWGVESYLADGNRYGVEGYDFVGWSFTPSIFVDGVGSVGAEVAYTCHEKVKYFLPICGTAYLYAVWQAKSWTILEYQNNEFIGEHRMYYDGPSMTFTAQNISGYNFVEWRKQYGNLSYYTVVSSEATITLNPNENMPQQGWGSYFLSAVYEQACVTEGTLITLADGRQVAVENLTGEEQLLVWNLFTGTFDSAPILFIDSEPLAVYEVIDLLFSDGSSVQIISEHGFYDITLNKYVYLDANAEQYIGHWFIGQQIDSNGDLISKTVQLTDVSISNETTVAYSPVTYSHLCYYVNGMLSMPGGIDGLFNIFEVDGQTMKYNEEAMQIDINTYGLFSYEDFNGLISEEVFDAVQAQYLKIAIGKGLLTWDDITRLITRYADLLP